MNPFHSRPCLSLSTASTLANFWSLLLVSLALLAVVPVNAQTSPLQTSPRIVGTSVDLEDLLVTVAWPKANVQTDLTVALLDADRQVVAAQPLQPLPGGRSQVSFDDFFQRLPERGLQFFAVIRDASGSDASQQYAWRVVLDCPHAAEPCRWATQDGLYTNALSLSESLRTTLNTLEADRASDLLADVLDQRPELRGSVFALATQLDRLDQRLDLKDDCFCAWSHASWNWPSQTRCIYLGTGELPDGTGNEREAFWGSGPVALAAAQARKSPNLLAPTAMAWSEHTMELNCWKVETWLEKVDLPLTPHAGKPSQTIRFPVLGPCQDSCLGTVESLAYVTYRLTTGTLQPSTDPNIDPAMASANVSGFVQRDSNNATQTDSWPALLQWASDSTLTSTEGWIRLPEEGVFVNSDTRLVTTTLQGTAEVKVEAKDDEVWSYGEAAFLAGLIQIRSEADCALLPKREAEIENWNDLTETEECGEPQIEPWED